MRLRVVAVGAFTAALSLSGAPAGTAAATYPVPLTIDSSGATDVTAQLTQFLSTVPDGATVSFRQGGRYRVEGTVLLQDRHGLTLDGNGATVFATTSGGPHRSNFEFRGGGPLSVRDLTVTGVNRAGHYDHQREWQAGFNLYGVAGATFSHVTISQVLGDFVYLGEALDGSHRWTDGVTVADSNFDTAGRQGIAITAARNVTIIRTSLARMAKAAVDIEPNDANGGAANVAITNNDFGPASMFFRADGAAGSVADLSVTANRLHGLPLRVDVNTPVGSRRQRVTIADNTSDAPSPSPAVSLTRVDRASIHGNQASIMAKAKAAVILRQSCAVAIGVNRFSGPARLTDSDDWPCPSASESGAPAPPGPPRSTLVQSSVSAQPLPPAARVGVSAPPTPTPQPTTNPSPTTAVPAAKRTSPTAQALIASALLAVVTVLAIRTRRRLGPAMPPRRPRENPDAEVVDVIPSRSPDPSMPDDVPTKELAPSASTQPAAVRRLPVL